MIADASVLEPYPSEVATGLVVTAAVLFWFALAASGRRMSALIQRWRGNGPSPLSVSRVTH